MDEPQTALSGIGQASVTATPLQMAMVSAGIANDGVVMRPYVVDEVRAPNLSLLDKTEESELSQAVSVSTADDLTEMMVATVDEGTAYAAAIPGVQVAGKTGTARVDRVAAAVRLVHLLRPRRRPQGRRRGARAGQRARPAARSPAAASAARSPRPSWRRCSTRDDSSTSDRHARTATPTTATATRSPRGSPPAAWARSGAAPTRVLSRPVAIKVLKPEYADDALFRTRFETEARHAGVAAPPRHRQRLRLRRGLPGRRLGPRRGRSW